MSEVRDRDVASQEAEMAGVLRESAQRLVADRTEHRRTRALRKTLPGYDPGLFATFAELGWLGILAPEADGGVGLGLAEMAAVVQELEKGLICEPVVVHAVLAARAIMHSDVDAPRRELLSALVEGGCRPALALDFDERLPEAAATPDGDGYRLTGRCQSVAGGAGATHFLAPAKCQDGWRLFCVPAEAAGLTLGHVWRSDDSPLGQLALSGVGVASDAVVASPAAAEAAIARALDETRIVVSASLLGLAEKMLDMTIEYMGIRKQYDQLIGSFQALQHKAVDLYLEKERAVAALGFALGIADDPEKLPFAALRAKGRCSAAAVRVAREAIQLHGAIGFTEEHDLGLYVKRALTLSAWLGNAGEQRRRFIDMKLALA